MTSSILVKTLVTSMRAAINAAIAALGAALPVISATQWHSTHMLMLVALVKMCRCVTELLILLKWAFFENRPESWYYNEDVGYNRVANPYHMCIFSKQAFMLPNCTVGYDFYVIMRIYL